MTGSFRYRYRLPYTKWRKVLGPRHDLASPAVERRPPPGQLINADLADFGCGHPPSHSMANRLQTPVPSLARVHVGADWFKQCHWRNRISLARNTEYGARSTEHMDSLRARRKGAVIHSPPASLQYVLTERAPPHTPQTIRKDPPPPPGANRRGPVRAVK